jgi:hypothetical protein
VTSRLRATALIAAASLALHQLRYLLASDHAAAANGHAYLPFAGLLAALLLAAAGAELVRVVAIRGGCGPARPLPFRRAWPLAAVALLAVFFGQELLEGMLSAGRANGAGAVFAGGGWVAVPLAAGFGGLVAAFLAGARAVLRVAGARRRAAAGRAAEGRRPALPRALRSARPLIAANLAGRAPPFPC